MQGRIAGFFMTLFMALPLAAIPLMSIFGIPQIGSLASSLQETGFLLENPAQPELDSASAWDVNAATAPAFGSPAPELKASPVVPVSAAAHQNFAALSSNSVDAAFQNDPNSFTPGHPTGNALASSGQAQSWEQAIQQLSRFGIRDYRLQPGHQSRGFHFACYAHQGNATARGAGTVIRFEAEAHDPLVAVQQTLSQVERWYQQNYSPANAAQAR